MNSRAVKSHIRAKREVEIANKAHMVPLPNVMHMDIDAETDRLPNGN